MFHCLIVGSRNFDNYELLKQKCDYLLQNYKDIEIVSDGARGADTLAERYAKENNYELRVFKADWDNYGKSAGYIRNDEMHKYISLFEERGVIAFWDGKSKGTSHNFSLAKKYNNKIKIIKY